MQDLQYNIQQNNSTDIRFEALFNSASIGIIVVDAQGIIVMANDFANHQFLYQNNSMVGEVLEKLIPTRFHHKHVGDRNQYLNKPKARGMGIGMTLSALRKDGSEFPVEISLGHFNTNGIQYAIAYIVDITRRQENEAQILKQQSEMELVNEEMKMLNANLEKTVQERTNELQKILNELENSKEELTKSLEKEKVVNDLKSRFVSMASHEFRTPLSTVLSSIALLAKYTTTDDQPKRDKHIERIKSSVKTLTDILNEFLSLGKIEEGKVEVKSEVFNVNEFIDGLIYEMSVLLKPGQEIKYDHKGNTEVYTDSSLLKHVLINLLSNAIKFSPNNAFIYIETKVDSDTTTFRITDQGMGIPSADQVHLFERFFRATNATNIQGTGLGLHIVGRYVEILNGIISYHSELEKGSTFTIVVPTKFKNDFD
ncbi:MAG: PAS domain-containing sensor histidine kinase [Chitinophagia bacterium]|jgi:PAS domain S-box-containing protein|nr:PAS domain-containing sensor histidine kinase [Chitinophagia bacterium]